MRILELLASFLSPNFHRILVDSFSPKLTQAKASVSPTSTSMLLFGARSNCTGPAAVKIQSWKGFHDKYECTLPTFTGAFDIVS